MVPSATISMATLGERCKAAEHLAGYDIIRETSTPLMLQDEIIKKNRLTMTKLKSALCTETGSMDKSTSPGNQFLISYQRDPETMSCKHVRYLMATLMDRPGGIEAVLSKIETDYQSICMGVTTVGSVPTMYFQYDYFVRPHQGIGNIPIGPWEA